MTDSIKVPARRVVAAHMPDYLRRAWALVKAGKVERMGPNQFRVCGNEEPEYFVDLTANVRCYCLNSQHSGPEHRCKHALAGDLLNLKPELLTVLVQIIEFVEEEAA